MVAQAPHALKRWPDLIIEYDPITRPRLLAIRFEKFSAPYNRNDITTKKVPTMSLQCPRCHSPKITAFHHAMKIAAAVGTVGGAALGVSTALAGGHPASRYR
ncbi:hypothetical protein D3C72_2220170 [compost metagenome]